MIEAGLLKNLLLTENPRIIGLSEYLNQVALLFIVPAFYVGMIIEYFTNFDFQGVAKRAFIAFLAIKLLMPIHIQMVDQSLSVSSTLLSKYSSGNKFLTAYQNASVVTDSSKGIWDRLKGIVAIVTDDSIVVSIFLFSYGAFFLLTQLYGLIYHLTLSFIGLCAVLSIFPITSKSLKGAVYSSLWCVVMPFVVMIVLSLVGDSDAFLKDYTGGIVQNIESLIQLLVMMILLLMTPFLTSKIMNGTGLNSVADNIGQMAAMSTMVGGASYASKIASSSALKLGSADHSVSSKPLMNRVKDNLSKKATQIADNKNLGVSLNSLASDSFRERTKGTLNDLKDNFAKTNWAERAVLGADAIVNRKENQLAGMARKEDAISITEKRAESPRSPSFRSLSSKIALSSSKAEARQFNNESRENSERLKQAPNANSFLSSRKIPEIKAEQKGSFRDKYFNHVSRPQSMQVSREMLALSAERITRMKEYQNNKRGRI